MPRCLMAKKWKAAPGAELGDESDEEIDVVGEGRGRSPAPAATAPGPPPRDPEPTLLYNASSTGMSSAAAFFILPIIMQRFGRKPTTILLNICMIFGWIAFIFAKDKAALFTARLFHGVKFGSTIVYLVLVAEYANPKQRGYFTVTYKLTTAAGAFLCHVLYLCLSWRHIAVFGSIFNIISVVMAFFWPESPTYLVTRNRYEECEKSFTWLHGSKNKEELLDLISTQEAKSMNQKPNKKMADYCKIIKRKDFQKAFFISLLCVALLETSGRHYFAVYLIQMMVELLGAKSTAVYISIGYDVLCTIGLLISAIIVKKIKRRILFLRSAGIGVLLMFIISATLSLKLFYPVASLDYWSVSVILLYSLVSNIGVQALAFTIVGEIFPLDTKGLGVSLSGIVFAFIFTVAMKLTPILMAATGLSGTFVINACLSGVILCILHFILPETKDKTLLDIEREMRGEVPTLKETMPMI